MFFVYYKKLLSKDILKKVDIKEAIYISLFGVGLSIILLNLSGVLTKLIPSYMNVQNQLQTASNLLLQLILTIIILPVYEEIIFRYVIFGYLKKNYSMCSYCTSISFWVSTWKYCPRDIYFYIGNMSSFNIYVL